MTPEEIQLGRSLMARGIISRDVLNRVARDAEARGRSLAEALIEHQVVDPSTLRSLTGVASRDDANDLRRSGVRGPIREKDPEPLAGLEPVRLLGEGAMGQVWLARDPALGGRLVAVKTLHPHMIGQGPSVERFFREAQAVATITHPNIVRIHRIERSGSHNRIVMEYVEGKSLDVVLREEGSLPPQRAVSILEPIASGLAAAHQAGVLHRDIKPANILVETETGRPVLSDFGLARLHGARTLTKTGDVLGSPVYMSPEQARGERDVGEASDTYSLCATLYKLVVGVSPFAEKANVTAILDAVAGNESPRPAGELLPDLDPALDRLIRRGMDPNPRRRFPSAEALEQALKTYRTEGTFHDRQKTSRHLRLLATLVGILLLTFLGWTFRDTFLGTGDEATTETASSESEGEPEAGSETESSTEPDTPARPVEPAITKPEPLPAGRAWFTRRPRLERETIRTRMNELIAKGWEDRAFQVAGCILCLRRVQLAPNPDFFERLRKIVGVGTNWPVMADERKWVGPVPQRSFYYRWLDQEVIATFIRLAQTSDGVRTKLRDWATNQARLKREYKQYSRRQLALALITLAHLGEGVELLRMSQETFLSIDEAKRHLPALALLPVPDEKVEPLLAALEKGEWKPRWVRDPGAFRIMVRLHVGAIRQLRAWLHRGEVLKDPEALLSQFDLETLAFLFPGALETMTLDREPSDPRHPFHPVARTLQRHVAFTQKPGKAKLPAFPRARDHVIRLWCELLTRIENPDQQKSLRKDLRRVQDLLKREITKARVDAALIEPLVSFIDHYLE